MSQQHSSQNRSVGKKWEITRDLYAYFRAAEYPLGRIRAWKCALQMAFVDGWPR